MSLRLNRYISVSLSFPFLPTLTFLIHLSSHNTEVPPHLRHSGPCLSCFHSYKGGEEEENCGY
uniref:Uncharacterized protein n=1 Tax=Anguilla anguilla TaxID=7936 RepID=A0A0E9RI67_ANGAN